jgi:hypothetical protein
VAQQLTFLTPYIILAYFRISFVLDLAISNAAIAILQLLANFSPGMSGRPLLSCGGKSVLPDTHFNRNGGEGTQWASNGGSTGSSTSFSEEKGKAAKDEATQGLAEFHQVADAFVEQLGGALSPAIN